MNNKLLILLALGLLVSYFVYTNLQFIMVLMISLILIAIIYYKYQEPITDTLKKVASLKISIDDVKEKFMNRVDPVEIAQTSTLCQLLGNLNEKTVPTRYEAMNSTLEALLYKYPYLFLSLVTGESETNINPSITIEEYVKRYPNSILTKWSLNRRIKPVIYNISPSYEEIRNQKAVNVLAIYGVQVFIEQERFIADRLQNKIMKSNC